MVVGGLAAVAHGWDGSISCTVGATSASVSPSSRSSVAEVMCALTKRCEAILGGSWSLAVDTDGVLTLSSSLTFSLAATGETATRTGFTGPYTGSQSYTGAAATSGYYPSYGIQLDSPTYSTSRASSTGDGSGAGLSQRVSAGGVPVTMWGTHQELWTIESEAQGTFDAWLPAQLHILARLRIEGWSRTRIGKLPQHCTLTANAQEVS